MEITPLGSQWLSDLDDLRDEELDQADEEILGGKTPPRELLEKLDIF